MLKTGATAPDFRFGQTSLYEVLEERSAVLFFFPRAFTPICTREAGAFGREYKTLRASGCEVLGISNDTQEVNDHFRASLDLPYTLVGDPHGTLCRVYDVVWPLVGRTKRVTYVVSRKKRIRLGFHSEFGFDAHAAWACKSLVQPEP